MRQHPGVSRHQLTLGTHLKRKLTPPDILEIRRLKRVGFNQTEISRVFGVTRQQISLIVTKQAWKHIWALMIPPNPFSSFEKRKKENRKKLKKFWEIPKKTLPRCLYRRGITNRKTLIVNTTELWPIHKMAWDWPFRHTRVLGCYNQASQKSERTTRTNDRQRT